MKSFRMTLLATAAAALTLGMAGAQAAQKMPVSAAENMSRLWFVEFNSLPTSEGAQLSKVRAEKAAFREAARKAGIQFKERRAFDVLFNGISIDVSPEQRAKIARLPGVKAMYPVEVIDAPKPIKEQIGGGIGPMMNTAPSMTGANVLHALGIQGQGLKVGIIDTGIDIDHPALGGNGTPGSTAFPSTKVAYGYDFVGDAFNADSTSPSYNPVPVPDTNPDDCGGHGSHVAGIVGADGALTGVAPKVTLGAYRVFGCAGSTTADVMIAAMEMALADGMNVVNQSIGSAFQWPEYPTAKAANRLVKNGVVMVASIGNSGTSGLYAAGAPGVGKDVIGVASFDNTVATMPQFEITPDGSKMLYNSGSGGGVAPTSGSSPMARTGTQTSLDDGCAVQPAGSLTGKVALIRRGTCGFYQKAYNAQVAGAVGVVLYNNTTGRIVPSVVGTPPVTIPVVSITAADGVKIDSLLASGSVDMTWRADVGSEALATAGLISSFSSYGLAADLSLKPNIGAPGGSIYSTYPLELGGYASLSGTSMSSPHTAGGAALILQADPKQNAKTMRDRLQNSADPKAWWGNPAAGFIDQVHRQGAGMLDLVGAANATVRILPGELSLGESQAGPATRTLTFTNKGNTPVTYDLTRLDALATGPNSFTVSAISAPSSVDFSPTSVTVPAKGSATVNVTIAPNAGLADKSLYGGYVVATPQGGGDTLRVPFAGFKGDYQAIQVLAPTANGFPWLTKFDGASFFNQPGGASYTLAGNDVPYVYAHLDHHSRLFRVEAFPTVDNPAVLPGNLVSLDSNLPRNSTASGGFVWPWDGTVAKGKNSTVRTAVPNGTYTLKVSVLKALGDPANPAHWETWTSPVVTIARP